MAIDIVKLANGNVALYDATSGDFLRSLSPDVVEIECNEQGEVKVIEDNGNVEYFDPAEVANTEVVPAAAIPFAGDCAALAELLATDFFFVSGGATDAASITYDNSVSGLTATNVQDAIDELAASSGLVPFYADSVWTSFMQVPRTMTNSALGVGLYAYSINVPVDTVLINAKLEITAFNAADGYFALYTIVNGVITNRVHNFAYSITGNGEYVFNFPANTVLPAGNYGVAISHSVIQTYRSFQNPDNPLGIRTTLSSDAFIKTIAVAVTGTPATFPAGGLFINTFDPALVVFETEIA